MIRGGFMFVPDAKDFKKVMIINRLWLFVMFVVMICLPAGASAEDTFNYGSRFEFGIGGGYSAEYSRPGWSSESSGLVMITGAVRLWKGLGVQGGVDFGHGGRPDADSLAYGSDYILNPNKGTYSNSKWLGLRYEIPMKLIKQDFMGINSFYVSGAYCWSDYGVRSTEWLHNSVLFSGQTRTKYQFSKMEGQVYSVAARWKADDKTVMESPWLGAYGADFGLKYTRYEEGDPELPGLEKSRSGFNNLQVFFTVYMKFNLLEGNE